MAKRIIVRVVVAGALLALVEWLLPPAGPPERYVMLPPFIEPIQR